MKRIFLILFILNISYLYSIGQEKNEKLENRYHQLLEQTQRLKDSLSLLHPLVPAVSSVLLKNNQIEINLFNSLITANEFRDGNGHLTALNTRQSYLYNSLQFTYGLSKKARFNMGLDINSIAGRIDGDRNSSLFKVFHSKVEGNNKYARAFTSIGPRIRWRPFNKDYRFTLQSSIIFPTLGKEEKKEVLGQNQLFFLNQLLYNQPLSKRLFLFTQLGVQYGFKNDNAASMIVSPVSGYLSYIIPKKTILFALINYIPVFKKEASWDYTAYTTQLGGGLQYYITKNFLTNLFYANDISGKNYQDFDSYNISLRYVID